MGRKITYFKPRNTRVVLRSTEMSIFLNKGGFYPSRTGDLFESIWKRAYLNS